jgi:FkbM family methyltransferase
LKRLLRPLLSDSLYSSAQAAAMAFDIRRGALTEAEVELLPKLVKPGDTVLDIGANYGLYSYHLSRLVGPAGRVYAFEPLPFTARTFRIVRRLLGLGNVTLLEKGAGDQNARVSFTLPVQESGAPAAGQAHLSGRDDERPGREIHHQYERTREVACEIVRIDDALPHLAETTFIKADIEGTELLALRGAERLVARDAPTVLCEINPWFLQGFGLNLQDLLAFFAERGYGFYAYDDGARLLRAMDVSRVTEDNYLFVHPRRGAGLTDLIAG